MKQDNKFIWTTKMGEKGQIVIPKEAREIFKIEKGDTLLIFGDLEKGLAIGRQSDYIELAEKIFNKG